MQRVFSLLVVLLLATAPAAPGEDGTFRVGAAIGPSSRALVVSDGSETLAIVDLEGPYPERNLRKEVLARLPRESKLGRAGLVVVMGARQDESTFHPDLAAEVAGILRSAEEALAPAKLRFGRHTVRGLVENRRDPAGPLDESIAVLRATGADGRTLATFVCYSIPLPKAERTSLRKSLGEADGGPPVLLAAGPFFGLGPTSVPEPGRSIADRAERALKGATGLRGRIECRAGTARLPPADPDDGLLRLVKPLRIRIGSLTLLCSPAVLAPGTGIRIRAEAGRQAGGPAVLLDSFCPTAGPVADGPEWPPNWSRYGPGAPAAIAKALGIALPAPPAATARARLAGSALGRRDRDRLRSRLAIVKANPPPDRALYLRSRDARRATLKLRDAGFAALRGVAEGSGLPLDEILLLHESGALPGIAPRIEPAPAEIVSPAGPNGVRVERSVVPSPLPSGDARNDRIPLEHFVPPGRARGAIVVLPMWKGGALLAERLVAGHLSARGYRAVIMPLPWQFGRCPPGVRSGSWTVSDDLERTEAALVQAHADVREVVTRLRARDDVEKGRVGVLGISLGAFVAAASYRDDPRLGAAVLVMAGGDPASVAWSSRRMRAKFEGQGFTLASLRERFGILDPAASRAAPAHPGFPRYRGVLMLNALNDRIVPKANAEILWRAFGEPAIEWYPEGHYSMALRFPELMARMDRHLDPLFPVPPVPSATDRAPR